MATGHSVRALSREWIGLLLIFAGEALLAIGLRPGADFYFPLVWFGYILALDGMLARFRQPSIYQRAPRLFWLMIPVSALFWWIFELFDLGVHSWRYVNTAPYQGVTFIVLASVSFSTVLLAVWETATCVHMAIPRSLDRLRVFYREQSNESENQAERSANRTRLSRVMWASAGFGVVSILLPLLLPGYAFGMIWVSLFFLLDPLNFWMGRPSLIAEMAAGRYRTAMSFGLGTLICGFFWESWNYWAPMKWVYNVPFVSQFHLFEMPILGYSGYIPFGLELYAMANFALPTLARVLRIDLSGLGHKKEDDREPAAGELSIPA
jgi:hypothetical protein